MSTIETRISNVIKAAIPAIDDQLLDYVQAILAAQSYKTAEDIEEAVGEVLQSCIDDMLGGSSNSTSSNVESICESLVVALKGGDEGNGTGSNGLQNGDTKDGDSEESSDDDGELAELDKPVCLGAIKPIIVVKHGTSQSFWSMEAMGAKPRQIVDEKKLARAERRLVNKARKRDDTPEIQYRALPVNDAVVNQAINRKNAKADQSGANRSLDIRIENFDISFGSQILLEGADLNLSEWSILFNYFKIFNIFFYLKVTASSTDFVDGTESER